MNFIFKDHIHIKCKAATLNIIKIHNIRKYLTRQICNKLILQMVTSHLDYANSMFAGLPSSSIKLMQRVHNTATRLVLRKKCHGKHNRMPQNPTLATNTRADRVQNMQSHLQLPQQTSSSLSPKPNSRENNNSSWPQIRNRKALLEVPNIRKQTFASRSFSVYGLKLWNSLPNTIREEVRFEKFKSKLKTHLFITVYM